MPIRGSDSLPLQWKLGVSTPGPLRESPRLEWVAIAFSNA